MDSLSIYSIYITADYLEYSFEVADRTDEVSSKHSFEVADRTDEVSNIYLRKGDVEVIWRDFRRLQ